MKKNKYLWLCVTKDKYELPLAVADTAVELGKMIGKNPQTIRAMVSRKRRGACESTGYLKIRV